LADAVSAHGDTIIVVIWRGARWTTAVVRDRNMNLHFLTARLATAPNQRVLRARVPPAAAVGAGADLAVRDGDVALLVRVDHTIAAVLCTLYGRRLLELAAITVDLRRARIRSWPVRLDEMSGRVDFSHQCRVVNVARGAADDEQSQRV
jgi:hypothetical protein